MDCSIIEKKRAEVKKTMSDLCKSAAEDQKLCDEIKNRGFWERLFANNTRDLANAGLAHSELIGNLQSALQGVMEIVKDGAEREKQILSAVDELRASGDASFSALHEAVGKVIGVVLKDARVISHLKVKIDADDAREDSRAAAQKCAAELKDYCSCATSVDGDEFCARLEHLIKTNFCGKGVALRNEDKAFLVDQLTSVAATEMEYDRGFGRELVKTHLLIEDVLERISPEGDRYSRFRDELVGILTEFVGHRDEIDPNGRSVAQLIEVKRQLLENQFEIALIGEFQGGKSTTFNALCGGREISPRGLGSGGVKTSAAVITAQNIAGDESRNGLAEWAEIKWLSKNDLRYRVASVLLDQCDPLPDDATLSTALKDAWKTLPADDGDACDMLRVATLQLRLLLSKEYDAFLSRTVVAIDEFQQYVQFPKDWEMRWAEKEVDADFSLEECLFAALDSVLVRIHSECLARLGCRITDCPGLFVSKWDTDRAFEVMSRSNAVWYLLNGNKEMDKTQQKVLKSIRQGGWQGKCFFTLNVKGDVDSTEGILRANVAKIKTAGFNVEHRIFRYNAAVAFRLAQLEYALAKGLGRRDIDCLAVESVNRKNKYADIREKLSADSGSERIKAIRELLYRVLIPTGYYDDEMRTMSESALSKELEDFAGLKGIVRGLERYVVTLGAAEILLGSKGSVNDDGSLRHCGTGGELCEQVLKMLQADKKAEEASAHRSFEAAKQKQEEDEKRFKRFQHSIEKEFAFLDDNTKLDDDFLDDFYVWAWKDIMNDARESAIEITLEEWNNGHWTNTGVKNAAMDRIKADFSRIFKLKLNAYCHQITSTAIYKKEIGGRIHDAWERLKEEWEEMGRENPHFEGLFPNEKDIDIQIEPFNRVIDQSIEVPSYFYEFFRNIGNALLSLFGADRVMIEDRIRRFFDEKDPIRAAMESLRDSYVKSKPMKEMFAQARIQNKKKIDASVEESGTKFKDRIEKEKDLMASSDEVRRQKAVKAKRVREEIIEPRIRMLEDFKARVKVAYGK